MDALEKRPGIVENEGFNLKKNKETVFIFGQIVRFVGISDKF